MVDYQRQLLDELMGRNRNLDPGEKAKEKTWRDGDNCKFFMVRYFSNIFVILQIDYEIIPEEVKVVIFIHKEIMIP